MTLRGTAVSLRRPPSWSGAGDKALLWQSLMADGEEVAPQVSHAQRAPRPQSAIEGGQTDTWLRQLGNIHSGRHLRSSVQDKVALFNERTASTPALNIEPVGSAHGQQGTTLYRRDYSSSGGTSQCERPRASQEFLQAGRCYPLERRECQERVRITQALRTEKGRLSSLAPVRIGWLPVQQRATLADAHSQNPLQDHGASQVKMKQPITPTLQNNPSNANGFTRLDGEVGKRDATSGSSGVRVWRAPDKDSPVVQQGSRKVKSSDKEGDGRSLLTWQALKRSWTTDKAPALHWDRQLPTNHLPTGAAGCDSTMKTPLMKTPLMKTTGVEPRQSHDPLHGLHPVKSPTKTKSSSHEASAPVATTSAAEPLKGGFSSITICSRKVTRSASLPALDNPTHYQPDQARTSAPPPPHAQPPADPKANAVSLQRKATIVKVTEHSVTTSPVPSRRQTESPSCGSHGDRDSDTVVHSRKATIIKVTKHSECHSIARPGSRARHPGHRHSYIEGLYAENNMWHQELQDPSKASSTPSNEPLEYPENTICTPNTSTLVTLRNREKNGRPLHRSTLNLFVSNSPTGAASTKTSPKAVEGRAARVIRPRSCYDNEFGHTEEPSKRTTSLHPTFVGEWSFVHAMETDTNPVNHSNGGFFCPGTVVRERAQTSSQPNSDGSQTVPPTQKEPRRPSLTLIKAPDTNSQSAEEVVALNAAAIIANIKLQIQLHKEKSTNGNSGKDSTVAPQGNIVGDVGKLAQPSVTNHTSMAQPLQDGAEPSAQTTSLRDALARSRPDFISRSRGRVRELKKMTQERRELAKSEGRQSGVVLGRKTPGPRPASQTDNIFKPGHRAITDQEKQFGRSYNAMQEGKRKREEEKRREVCLTNRLRADIFKKKLLDEVLQRDK